MKLYGTNPSTTAALSSYLNLVVTQGTGGSFASGTGFTPLASNLTVYSGTLAGFASTATNYATGLGTWTPTGGAAETRSFQISYTVDPAAPNTTQGGTAALGSLGKPRTADAPSPPATLTADAPPTPSLTRPR